MSNPTIATKLTSLIKGIFGRKDQVATTTQDKKDETPATETPAKETAESTGTTEAPAESPEAATEAPETEEKKEEPAAEDKAAEKKAEAKGKPAANGKPSDDKPEAPVEAPATEAAEAAELVEEPKGEPTEPATADVPEDGSALAEELEAAEAHTKVASDDVLERVRKDVSPSAEDLAVPTYDELTLPSIRARLRKLTIDQVRDLRSYEVAHEGRPEFIKMYDNRIAKLESGA
ncbi:hypothetical protein [Nocardiopsis nanhaiensis]